MTNGPEAATPHGRPARVVLASQSPRRRDLLALVAPFPDARFEVRDVQTNRAERYAGLRIAVTWVMRGTYRGTPAYGPLTGAEVELLGVSQFLVQDGRIVKEVRVYDEIALRAQIDAGRSDEFTDTNIY